MSKKWECYLCGNEDKFQNVPNGYLGNYHPLCHSCSNEVLENENHPHRVRLTYHSDLGDLNFIKEIPVQKDYLMKN